MAQNALGGGNAAEVKAIIRCLEHACASIDGTHARVFGNMLWSTGNCNLIEANICPQDVKPGAHRKVRTNGIDINNEWCTQQGNGEYTNTSLYPAHPMNNIKTFDPVWSDPEISRFKHEGCCPPPS